MDASDRTLRAVLGIVLVAAIIGGGVDLFLDAPESLWSPHVIYEVALIIAAMAAFLYLWRGWWAARGELRQTRQQLEERAAQRDVWRASAEAALAGFGHAIDERFQAWGLTAAESEVALLLLKGRSHKEIAYSTRRSERTVRQHAVSVYQKSKLGGRAELAAFFLDDLLLPASSSLTTESRYPGAQASGTHPASSGSS